MYMQCIDIWIIYSQISIIMINLETMIWYSGKLIFIDCNIHKFCIEYFKYHHLDMILQLSKVQLISEHLFIYIYFPRNNHRFRYGKTDTQMCIFTNK